LRVRLEFNLECSGQKVFPLGRLLALPTNKRRLARVKHSSSL
jgi:hypothetical protein